jgi:integrase/recombinase XerD
VLRNKDQIDLIKSINHITNGLPRFACKQLTQQISPENAVTIIEFIKCQKTESNLSDGTKNLVIRSLMYLVKYCKNKNFKQLTRADILNYLDSLRKSEESDPIHRWIGTYNLRRQLFLKFFKWLYYPTEIARKRKIPEVMRDIPMLKRKEQSIYKPDDLWTAEDDRIFLKYCSDKRIQCYHTISRDASTRPDEILRLRVKDINFKLAGDKTYAQISVNGKTGNRVIPLFNSIPYIKDWINNHPQPGNPNALLIPSVNRSTFGRKMSSMSLNGIYHKYRTKRFPRLLNDENIPIEDKNKIRELLKKPWNPYIRRHTGLTEKSKMKQINEHQLRQLAGWSPRSQMHLKYIHYFGNEASESLLEAYGLVTMQQEQSRIMQYKQCQSCNEPNKSENRFCTKCKMVMTYDAYNETIEKEQKRESEIKDLKEKYEQDMKSVREQMNQVMMIVQRNPRLARIKPEILVEKTPA